MNTKHEDGYAFPVGYHPDGNRADQQGMTLRDYFAAKAIPYALTRDYGNDWGKDGLKHHKLAAKEAYRIADAMLESRKQ